MVGKKIYYFFINILEAFKIGHGEDLKFRETMYIIHP